MESTRKQRVSEILGSVLTGSNIDRESASELSSARGADLWDLLAAAGRVRDHFRGSTVDICST
jgi:biotin synthase-like enzyme